MGEVVQLPLTKRRSSLESDGGDGRLAQILFFTGVRYQRMPEIVVSTDADGTGAPSHGGMSGKRKRKRG
jgi:hypothetical protein